MIFVTVGSQMPFDRLVKAMDAWASVSGRPEVFAQTGQSDYVPQSMEWVASLTPTEYKSVCRKASVIVAHAGMGSIITAAEFGKPILVMPRRGALRETRNDHQVATARWLSMQGRVRVAMDTSQLEEALGAVLADAGSARMTAVAPDGIIGALRDFIQR